MTGFGRAVASEFVKLFSTRMWWLLLLILVGYVGLAAAGIALALTLAPEQSGMTIPPGALAAVVYSVATASGFVFPVILGAMSVTGEVRHRTLSTTFLATPHRAPVLAAKVVVAAVAGAGYGVAASLATVGLGALVLGSSGEPTALDESDTWAMIARMVLAMAIWAMLGVGLGVLVPSQVGSIVAILAFTQFVEPIVRTAAAFVEPLGGVAKFLPGAAGDALVGASFYTALGPSAQTLEWWQGGLVLAGYAVAFLVAGAATFWRRDVT
ncbi:MAG: ABC transporter permease [Microbacteriaceae bacterium]|nr:ABC transporter permease [Microbacteriaceae bacterium]